MRTPGPRRALGPYDDYHPQTTVPPSLIFEQAIREIATMQPGLYVVRRVTWAKIHVGILVVGGRPSPYRSVGVLVHFNQEGLHREDVYDLAGWEVLRRIDGNEAEAIARLNAVLQNPERYALLNNNCEHLVSFVETGERKSPQVRGWLAVGAIVASIALLRKSA